MPRVTFVDAAGEARTVAVETGRSLMQGALANGISGIVADCGGACACATCHVHVDRAWRDALPPMGAEEEAMLEMAIDPDANSRLSCQIEMDDALDGLTVTLPARQH